MCCVGESFPLVAVVTFEDLSFRGWEKMSKRPFPLFCMLPTVEDEEEGCEAINSDDDLLYSLDRGRLRLLVFEPIFSVFAGWG